MSDDTWDNDWLVFSRKSRRGTLVLLLIFVLVAVAPRIYKNYFLTNSLDPEIKRLALSADTSKNKGPKQKEASNSNKNNSKEGGESDFQYNIPSSPFDPNEYTFDDWKKIGFSDKQVKSIMSYNKNGGAFKVKSDVNKLYVVDDDLYNQLSDKIDLPNALPPKYVDASHPIENNTETERVDVNINTASIDELSEVPGIGPFFAKEILKIRENYGGIYDAKQLLEIYKMDKEKLADIEKYIIVDAKDIKKLNVNTATRDALLKHKEISWDIANSIVYIRERNGDYEKIDDLLKSVFINQEKLKLLQPYITID